eukprot:CAMPEP_0202468102 /NCGR_PEP_ID=MMETSP1360-20130828/74140_1 /ASSEMBLY_ACC=CAM_ASM_000848 /TAXON_ID=515479 /ORGANISM="Licmophora paradoxa, Strain CCMP2313" /LENGTH=245 /DNA_ID=CAMNT_0049092885 /DNA_START=57 /DNA_END=794 /DNA_ORIENTATION=-
MESIAVEMNNVGVNYLHNGNTNDALDMFQGALQTMMYLTQGVVSPNEDSLFTQDRRVKKAQNHLYEYECKRANKKRRNHIKENTTVSNFNGFIFTKAIYIPVNSPTSVQDRSHELQSAVILFNTALAIHLQPGDKKKETAEALYSMSYKLASKVRIPALFPQHGGKVSSDRTKALVRLIMGLLNNMGQINYHLGNFDKSRKQFAALSTFIASLPHINGDYVLAEEKQNMMLNTFLLNSTVAAAAA